jgi:hypothetical protein
MGVLVQNVLKITSLFGVIMLLWSSSAMANTKYFIIEEDTEDYHLTTYDLSTKSLYGIDRKVSLYNLILKNRTWTNDHTEYLSEKKDNSSLILFSVLPDLKSNIDWIEVSLDTIQGKMVIYSDLKKLFHENTVSFMNGKNKETTKYFNSYKPILKKGKQFFVPKNCLLEFYVVNNRPDIFSNPYGTINTQLSPISILEFAEIFKKSNPNAKFPLYTIGEDNTYTSFDRTRDRREYLSRILQLPKGTTAYQFWTYSDWFGQSFNYIYDRGIDRFVYHPSKGIIGGSFDFYFYFHRKKLPIEYADFMQNIKEEKVMIADDNK